MPITYLEHPPVVGEVLTIDGRQYKVYAVYAHRTTYLLAGAEWSTLRAELRDDTALRCFQKRDDGWELVAVAVVARDVAA